MKVHLCTDSLTTLPPTRFKLMAVNCCIYANCYFATESKEFWETWPACLSLANCWL